MTTRQIFDDTIVMLLNINNKSMRLDDLAWEWKGTKQYPIPYKMFGNTLVDALASIDGVKVKDGVAYLLTNSVNPHSKRTLTNKSTGGEFGSRGGHLELQSREGLHSSGGFSDPSSTWDTIPAFTGSQPRASHNAKLGDGVSSLDRMVQDLSLEPRYDAGRRGKNRHLSAFGLTMSQRSITDEEDYYWDKKRIDSKYIQPMTNTLEKDSRKAFQDYLSSPFVPEKWPIIVHGFVKKGAFCKDKYLEVTVKNQWKSGGNYKSIDDDLGKKIARESFNLRNGGMNSSGKIKLHTNVWRGYGVNEKNNDDADKYDLIEDGDVSSARCQRINSSLTSKLTGGWDYYDDGGSCYGRTSNKATNAEEYGAEFRGYEEEPSFGRRNLVNRRVSGSRRSQEGNMGQIAAELREYGKKEDGNEIKGSKISGGGGWKDRYSDDSEGFGAEFRRYGEFRKCGEFLRRDDYSHEFYTQSKSVRNEMNDGKPARGDWSREFRMNSRNRGRSGGEKGRFA